MGSLMAGWGSQVHDPRTVKFERNKSLTKEGIESYWRSKKKAEEEHLRDIADILMKTTAQESTLEEPETERKLDRSSSLPLPSTKQGLPEVETETSLGKLLKKNGWWTRSNSAFLNEPPVIQSEGPTYRYASQFHVAGIGSSNSHPQTGISA